MPRSILVLPAHVMPATRLIGPAGQETASHVTASATEAGEAVHSLWRKAVGLEDLNCAVSKKVGNK